MIKAIALLLSIACFAFAEADKPNFLFILADDLGIKDMSVEGSTLHETPHIDSIANEGMRFTDCHSSSSVCSPTRYGLLTGINPVRTGVLNTLLAKGKPIISEKE